MKPEGSSFVLFKPAGLPPGAQIVHKLDHGNVDLELVGMGDSINRLQEEYGGRFEPEMLIARASKSAAIRIKVPVLDPAGRFEGQRPAALQGMEAARRLLQWARRFLTANSGSAR